MNSDGPNDWIKGLALLAWISWEILALSGAGLAVGYLICRWLGISLHWIVLSGIAGLVVAFARIYQAVQALESSGRRKGK